ncbi:MAG: hypothetical protein PHD51_04665 [Patescibacteria group bacterium]|nr:hypothetical protein [Patescibacteria group bacterium]MDD5490781.1 hypothetical protein [Patescibacteria group bacterium]
MQNKIDDATKSILIPLVYFDIFDYPLTLMEVWEFSFGQGISLNQTEEALSRLKEKGILESREGFFYLANRAGNVSRRRERYLIAERKFKKAKKFSRWLRFAPGVRGVAVCNTLAYSNSPEESDIDFFIIAAAGKIWSARFWSVILSKFFGGRPRAGKTRDTLCLSFFATADNLNLETITSPLLKNKWFGDIYLIYWLNKISPLYQEDKVFEKFFQDNGWLREYLPNGIFLENNPRRALPPTGRWLKNIVEFFGGNKILEPIFRKYQFKIMPNRLKEISGAQDTRVIISNKMLKFHSDDRRAEFALKFEKIFSRFYE